ncbi:beta-L-arabinofuranosidase domain-containing protein [Mucilaginibacter lacusdianchii]|uniref:beta-L-arabinofuranosidase domain-containing protein n=1 Tax=Mucilaginibacter lacusdianchii TaxID=2684211 RepID=UPI00131D1FCD|nr:beta-L-arabinofuranosidase domain-containing protein [Mucilaginibacter sp. JXJ CY 39]
MISTAKSILYSFSVCALSLTGLTCYGQTPIYFNRAPLKADSYAQLPLGSIKAKGWLKKQLELQKDGATGHAEELYPGKNDLGKDADWLGGDGNSWEKAPYYLKGLVALAYTLDDAGLKAKAQKWIDYTLNHQAENGLFGPVKMKDWWPRMPFLYALQSYYEATNDKRVIPFMSKYFKYELANLDQDPLREWSKSRAGDNMDVALWLYNQTGETYLLALVNKLKAQAYPWADIFNNNQFFYYGRDFHTRHMVSVAEALKFPMVYSQVDASPYYANAMQNGINFIMREHGQPQGLGSGTEFLAGKSSVQGVETCTVVEWMQSLETAFRISHQANIGDQLEKVAFNALPAQFSKDFKDHTYYTLPNQVQALPGPHGFNQDYGNGIVPSPYSGYPCCRYNMHMGWPYFVKNSWLATPDGGLAVNTYGPMAVTTHIANKTQVTIDEDTAYPFEEQVRLKFSLKKSASFPLKLRIPAWCKVPNVLVNGQKITSVKPGQMLVINRKWKSDDKVVLNFPMHLQLQPQVNNAVSVERGPLVYALKIKQAEKHVKEFPVKGFYETEISTASAWNYGLVLSKGALENSVQFVKGNMPENPFMQDVTPVSLKIKAKRISSWTIDDNATAALDVPYSPVTSTEKTQEVTLVPFGAESLRLSIFPTIGNERYITTNYQENFDDNTYRRLVNYGGGWYCKDKTIHTAANEDGGSGNGTKVIATGTRFSNFEYNADITVNTAGDAGLIFRVTNAAIGSEAYQGYYLGLNAEKGIIQLGKSGDKQWTVIASAPFPLQMNKTYKVTVRAVNNKFDVFINGINQAVITATDSQFATGSVGLRAYKALLTADNLSVKAL